MYFCPKLCIQTHKVLNVDETVKVVIQGLGYWVRLRESSNCFDSNEMLNARDNTYEESQKNEVRSPTFSYTTPSSNIPTREHLISHKTKDYFEHSSEQTHGMSSNQTSLEELNQLMTTEVENKGADPKWQCRESHVLSSEGTEGSGLQDNPGDKEFKVIQDTSCSEEEMEVSTGQPNMKSLSAKVSQIELGKKVGRTRKYAKSFNFFDFKLGGKRKTTKHTTRKRTQKVQRERTKRRGQNQHQQNEEINVEEGEEPLNIQNKDLATEILETGQLMGLIPYTDLESSLAIIRSSLNIASKAILHLTL